MACIIQAQCAGRAGQRGCESAHTHTCARFLIVFRDSYLRRSQSACSIAFYAVCGVSCVRVLCEFKNGLRACSDDIDKSDDI